MGEIVAAIGTCHTPYLFTRPPDEDPHQLDQAGAAMQELGKVLDETKPDVILFFGADHVETFSVTCVPVVRHRRRQPRDRQVRGPRAQPADPSRDGRGHPQQAGRRPQLRHGLLGRRRARARVLDSVRVRDRQAQHPGHPVLHQRLRPAPADAAAMRGARQGDRRDREGAQGARGDRRQRRHVALPRHHEIPAARNSTSIAGWSRRWKSATPTRC